MKLTPYQKRYLDALVTFRNKKPDLWRLLMFRPLSWIPFVIIAGLSIGLYCLLDARWGMFMMGMTVGAILRIIAYARFTLMAWPVTQEIIDWARVDALRVEEKP